MLELLDQVGGTIFTARGAAKAALDQLGKIRRETIHIVAAEQTSFGLKAGVARIEIAPEELEKALCLDMFQALADRFKAIGFRFVTLDVEGYRSGRLNEALVTLSESEGPEK